MEKVIEASVKQPNWENVSGLETAALLALPFYMAGKAFLTPPEQFLAGDKPVSVAGTLIIGAAQAFLYYEAFKAVANYLP